MRKPASVLLVATVSAALLPLSATRAVAAVCGLVYVMIEIHMVLCHHLTPLGVWTYDRVEVRSKLDSSVAEGQGKAEGLSCDIV